MMPRGAKSIATMLSMSPESCTKASELAGGVRVAARGKYAPSVSHVLPGKFEAEPTIGARDEDCCWHSALPDY